MALWRNCQERRILTVAACGLIGLYQLRKLRTVAHSLTASAATIVLIFVQSCLH